MPARNGTAPYHRRWQSRAIADRASPSLLVSDTSVLIDLERARLLEDLFRLPFELSVSNLLYDRKLAGELGNQLVELGLRVEVLTPAELGLATTVRRQNARLSVPDTFAFAIAQSRQWTLLTGDGTLRELAVAEQIDMHGVFWLFDRFADGIMSLSADCTTV
ncbi:hypothetical protein [Bradyrhizobium sp. Pa8]|uniref:hypothetical protein n=1 Tax=Bradyrhizobium sp. Pa8 TaxID=3386552 RepID=UPI00403F3E82